MFKVVLFKETFFSPDANSPTRFYILKMAINREPTPDESELVQETNSYSWPGSSLKRGQV